MKNKEGWDGKLRVEPKAVITNPEALEDSDYSDSEAPPVEEIDADEGKASRDWARAAFTGEDNGLMLWQTCWKMRTQTQRFVPLFPRCFLPFCWDDS